MYKLQSPVKNKKDLPLLNNKNYDVRICSDSFLSYVWLNTWIELTEENYDLYKDLDNQNDHR